MNRRGLLSVLGLGVVTNLSDTRATELDQKAALEVRIVPTTYQEKGGGFIVLNSTNPHFYVVITNISGKPIRLWKEWMVAGFWLWEVKDMDEAVAWVKRCPNPMPGPSEIENRLLNEMADFADGLTP